MNILNILKSKKLIITAIGSAICIYLKYLGADNELIYTVAGLFGLNAVAHTITDIWSMIKGLQKKKED